MTLLEVNIMINNDINNNLFDALYQEYKINGYIVGNEPNEQEKDAICKCFYILLPLILKNMSPRQREVITLIYGHNKTQNQVAKELNISQSNISTHLRIAYQIVNNFFNIIFKATLIGLRYEKRKN
jgi:RNA polymerase sigma factor (sigma-70 family)